MAIVPQVAGCTMGRVPPSPYVIRLGDAERAELESVSRRATAPFRLVVRARVVLLAAGGVANCAIAERLGICQDTARKWRRRYCQQGIDGLADAPRPGRPRVFPATVVAAVKALACEMPAAQILVFEQHYNAAARPFGWTFTRTDLNRLLARIRHHDRHAPHPLAA
jgi:transposase